MVKLNFPIFFPVLSYLVSGMNHQVGLLTIIIIINPNKYPLLTIVDQLLSHISMAGPSPTTSRALWPSFRVQLRLWPFDLSWGDGMNMKYMGASINGGIQKCLVYFMKNIWGISYYITNIYININMFIITMSKYSTVCN